MCLSGGRQSVSDLPSGYFVTIPSFLSGGIGLLNVNPHAILSEHHRHSVCCSVDAGLVGGSAACRLSILLSQERALCTAYFLISGVLSWSPLAPVFLLSVLESSQNSVVGR
jgi:hypothetical protein